MADSIIRSISREVFRAFMRGEFKCKAFGKEFSLEHVNGKEYRVTMQDADIGLRFMAENGKLHFFMA